ncbi:CHRD domain-containing protein [Sinimarinibacterium sp. CAU 1509]|uniref:CHRD domain-containing protein n=1 Tax=Sinimarinibacterium sp. CAU 1509 TaxID=2562283 RepID=UPI0010ACFDC8|nr:CHRD domain-containing protein [Sinimarinibacterium sp. CAU 1509]TJY58772.1 CHRD domain-containing protein [Sinimarinibacterium sp. CAU 1509]
MKLNTLAVAGLGMAALWTQAANAGHLNTLLEAELNGRQQVPPSQVMAKVDLPRSGVQNPFVGDRKARGEAYVFGIDGDPLTLCYTIRVDRLAETEFAPGNGRAAHIHEGQIGENGPVVANLAWPQDDQAADCLTEGETGKFPTMESGIVQRILQNPENFYINLHNTEFPNGAIRGQLEDTQYHNQVD